MKVSKELKYYRPEMEKKIKNQRWIFLLSILLVCTSFADNKFSKTIKFSHGAITVQSSASLPEQPKIGLVLSGGGSRGLVHIGVLKALEENNIPINMIVGTSIGSMLGGLYASGYTPQELQDIMTSMDWNDIYKDEARRSTLFFGQKTEQDRYLLSIRFNKGMPFIPSGFSPGQKILSVLSDLILKSHYQARNNFDDLRIPFRSVCTDMISGNQIVLSKGNLAEAINASLAFPLLFSPVLIDSMLLVDGGLRSNLPVSVARAQGMDIIIAVDVTSGLRGKENINVPWEIVDQATTIMTGLAKELEQKSADVLLDPDLGGLLSDDFSHTSELIQIGMDIVGENIKSIKQKINMYSCNDGKHILINDTSFVGIDSVRKALFLTNSDSIRATEINKDLILLMDSGRYKKIELSIDSIHCTHLTGHSFGKISKIEYTGNSLINSFELAQLVALKEGQPLNPIRLEQDINIIIESYRQRGYSIMRIREIIWQEEIGRLHIVIDEGRIGKIRIEGNDKTKNFVILREFSKQRGTVFNWKNIKTAIQNVYATQLYERVNTNVVEEYGENILVIKVKEKSSQLLRIGAKYDSDRKAQAYLELGDENILGFGIKTMFQSRFGTRDGHLGIRIRDDRIFFSNFTYDLHAYYSWQINPLENKKGKYREERSGLRFRVGRQIRRIGQLIFELRNENIIDESLEGNFTHPQNIDLRTFAIRALADKLDRADFPTKGIYNHWAWETGNRFVLEAEEKYTKALVNLEGYYNFARVHNWHLRLFVGIGDITMPFSENFRLGGLREFYGFYENEFYGRQLFTLNIEYRYKLPIHFNKNNFIFKNVYISPRYDFGGIWKDPALVFSSNDFFSGAGIDLGIETLFGPLHIAYGKNTRSTGVIYFSLGFNY